MVSNRFPIKTLSNILLATQVLYWISQFRGTKLREFIGIRLCWYENLCRCSSKVWKYCRYRARFQDRQPAVTFQTCGANPGNFSGEPIRNGIWKVGFMLNIGILGLTISNLYHLVFSFHFIPYCCGVKQRFSRTQTLSENNLRGEDLVLGRMSH